MRSFSFANGHVTLRLYVLPIGVRASIADSLQVRRCVKVMKVVIRYNS